MLPEPALRNSSVDMTLALGAESFLRYRHDPARGVDPSGESCFINLVDLVINSKICYLTWPSSEGYQHRPELLERLSLDNEIPNCASVHLNKTTEKRVFKAFWEVFQSFGYEWFARWWNSHFSDPIVIQHHLPRLGNKARDLKTITDEGFGWWRELMKEDELKQLQPLGFLPDNAPHITEDAKKVYAESIAPYQYCYAYDVFRRGWQYAEATRQAERFDIRYCPHQLRQRALSDASDSWIEQARMRHWSWGRCIANIVKTNPEPIPLGQVTDWINGLVAANPPKWTEIPTITNIGSEDEYRKAVNDLLEPLRQAAHLAKIPRQKIKPLTLGIKVGKLSIDIMFDALKLSAVHTLLEMLPHSKVLDSVKFYASESIKDAVNHYQTGTFDYPGLLNPKEQAYALQKGREVILL